MEIQDISNTKPVIEKHFRKYPQASISAIFRDIRKKQYVSFFGDYPILSTIISTISELGIEIKHDSVKRAMRYSNELRGQRLLLNELLKCQITIRNASNLTNNQPKMIKPSHTSIQEKLL